LGGAFRLFQLSRHVAEGEVVEGEEEEAKRNLLARLTEPEDIGVGQAGSAGRNNTNPTRMAAWKVPIIPGAAGIITPTTSTHSST
jgi:hypothetical protein